MRNLRTSRALAIGLSVVVLLVAGSTTVVAGQAKEGCNLATLHGAWGARQTGTIPGPNGNRLELNVVSRAVFDGHGHWTTVDTESVSGTIGQDTASGTYTVNPDCTGTQTATVREGNQEFTIHLSFVLTDHATRSFFISTDPGNVLSGTAIREEEV